MPHADKTARAAFQKQYREKNREKRAEYIKAWISANPERWAAYQRKYRSQPEAKLRIATAARVNHEKRKVNPEYRAKLAANARAWRTKQPVRHAVSQRKNRLKRIYGLSIDSYRAMLDKQNCQCAICGRIGDNLRVDHNHQTGKVRGLLCHQCNTGLGMFSEKEACLMSAISYLKNQEAV